MFAIWKRTPVHVMTTVQSGTLSSTHEPVVASCMVDAMEMETSLIPERTAKTGVSILVQKLLNLNLLEDLLYH